MGSTTNLILADDYKDFLSLEKKDELIREVRKLGQQGGVGAATADRELARSIEDVAHGLSNFGGEVADLRFDLNRGFAGLGALFDWHMGTVVSLLEQQQTELNTIRDALLYVRKTDAKADSEDARRAWKMALTQTTPGDATHERRLTQAMDFFLSAAKKDPFDYTIHLDMGILLLENREQPDAALPHLQEAVATAQAENDREYESKAHFFAGRAHGLLGQNEEAYQETRRALELDPDATVKIYECARYCALTGRADECLQHVEKLLRVELLGGKVARPDAEAWWAKIRAKKDFDKARERINRFMLQITNEAAEVAESALTSAHGAVTTAQHSIRLAVECAGVETGFGSQIVRVQKKLNDASELVAKAEYFNFLGGAVISRSLIQPCVEISKTSMQSASDKVQQEIIAVKKDLHDIQAQSDEKIKVKQKAFTSSEATKTELMILLVVSFAAMTFIIGWSLVMSGDINRLTPMILFFIVVVVGFALAIAKSQRHINQIAQSITQLKKISDGEGASSQSALTRLQENQKHLEDALACVQRGEYLT